MSFHIHQKIITILGNFSAETRLVKVNCTCSCIVIFYFSSHVSFAKVSVQSLFPSHVFHISIFSWVFDLYIYSTTPTLLSHRFHLYLVGFALGLCPWSMADNLFFFFSSSQRPLEKHSLVAYAFTYRFILIPYCIRNICINYICTLKGQQRKKYVFESKAFNKQHLLVMSQTS